MTMTIEYHKKYRADNYERHKELTKKHMKTYRYYQDWENKTWYAFRKMFS